MSINGTPVGSYSHLGKTLTIVDSTGNEINAVIVGQETVFDATTNDVREGKVYAGEEGVKIGTKNIPSYRTYTSADLILPSQPFAVKGLSIYNLYDYTKFQCIISKFNASLDDSVFTDKISINNKIFSVNSTTSLSDITKNSDSKSIDLNIMNDTEDTYVIRSFLYREEI